MNIDTFENSVLSHGHSLEDATFTKATEQMNKMHAQTMLASKNFNDNFSRLFQDLAANL